MPCNERQGSYNQRKHGPTLFIYVEQEEEEKEEEEQQQMSIIIVFLSILTPMRTNNLTPTFKDLPQQSPLMNAVDLITMQPPIHK